MSRLSVPMLDRLLAPFDFSDVEKGDFLEWLGRPSPRCVRMRAGHHHGGLPFETEAVPWSGVARRLVDPSVRPSQCLEYAVGDYYIQDASSLLAVTLLEARSGEAVADLCAAPGGKSTAILESLGEGGWLLANEPIRSRCEVLEWNLARSGSPRYFVTREDPSQIQRRLDGQFDAVLVDAPCTGQSMWERGKCGENAFADQQIAHAVARQRRILIAALRLLKPGGRLVYSTCTYSSEENELQIQWLLAQFPDALEPLERPGLAPWLSRLAPGCYRVWPHRDRCDGGFAAGLIRRGDFDALQPIPGSQAKLYRPLAPSRHANAFAWRECEELGAVNDLVLREDRGRVMAFHRSICAAEGLPYSMPIGSIGKGASGMLPAHGLACLAPEFFTPRLVVELNGDQGRDYVQGLPLSGLAVPDGWCVATWRGRSLGWLKQNRLRANNHLPKMGRMVV
jgi:16S rRNA C967 or C1407 C5-methylase (RsmB/RsmF family)